nr:MAG TPA: DNA-directed RNA polymerase [Caudoviricetes sp.]
MIKCSTCGEQIELRKENRYEVVIEAGVLQKSFGIKDCVYEAFDCPHCGCQMLMHERFPAKEEVKAEEMSPVEKAAMAVKITEDLRSKNSETDEASAESTKDETSKYGDEVKLAYGPEEREGDDITLDYLRKMSEDELLAFCGENGIRIPEEYHNREYLIRAIKRHHLV